MLYRSSIERRLMPRDLHRRVLPADEVIGVLVLDLPIYDIARHEGLRAVYVSLSAAGAFPRYGGRLRA